MAAIFASNTAGSLAEPWVTQNAVTGGSVAFVNMSAGNIWIDCGSAVPESVSFWVPDRSPGYTSVDARGKLAATWARLKL